MTVNTLLDVSNEQETEELDSTNKSLQTGVFGTPTDEGNVN